MTVPPLTLAVLGCGRVIERLHLPAIRRCPEVRLVEAVEPDPARRAWAESALAGVPVEPGLTAMLGRVQPDAVLIATPPATHAGLALAAIGAGCHVLVEQPLATTAADARSIVAAAAARGRRVAVGFNRRFRRPYASSRTRLRQARAFSLQARLVTDVACWPGAAPDPVARHRAMLEDVAPHLLDLVPWLVSRPIAAVRADPAPPSGLPTGIGFTVRLSGAEVLCTAGHGLRYEESFAFRADGQSWIAHPWGLAPAGRYGRLVEKAQTGTGLLLSKALGRPNLTAQSIAGQLRAFVCGCRSEEAGDLAGPVAGLAAALALDALVASQEQGGRWIELNTLERE